ncbi:MAG: SurA N-terminal domain-containing protein, partial [Rhodospirillales bacterium]|nr:SurA N-terminal domain-containing protein [Rhodospirillales bacterium]
MLGSFREKILSWGVKILFGLLIISFGLWGIGDYNMSGSNANDAIAEVGGRSITGRDLDTEVQNAMTRMRRLLGPDFSDEQARSLGIIDQTLKTLVRKNVFIAGAEKTGLIVNDDALGQAIRNDDQFKTGGQFDRQAFFQALNTAGLSEAAFSSLYRVQLLQNQLLSPIQLGVTVPASLTDRVYRYRKERRVADVLRLDHTKFKNIPAPDSATLATFHKENAGLFTAPEYRALTVVLLQPEDVADEVDVPEKRVQDEYDSRIMEFTKLERREIQQILVSDEAKIQKISKRLSLGEDFAKVAKGATGLEEATLQLGNLAQRDLPIPALAEVAFRLAPDTNSEPIKTALGWHILRVGKVTPGSQKTLEDVRDQVTRVVQLDMAADTLVSLANKFEDDLGSGSTLEEAARRLNLKVIKVSSMDRRGLNDAGKPVQTVGKNMDILQVAFETEEGQDSVLSDFGSASFFTLRVDKVTPPTLRPLDKIRTGVAAAWKREQQAAAAEKKTAELIDQLKGGKSLQSIAERMKARIS